MMEIKEPVDAEALVRLFNAAANFVTKFQAVRQKFVGDEASDTGTETDIFDDSEESDKDKDRWVSL